MTLSLANVSDVIISSIFRAASLVAPRVFTTSDAPPFSILRFKGAAGPELHGPAARPVYGGGAWELTGR